MIVWDMKALPDIVARHILRGHEAAVMAVRFDEKFVVSGSRDNTIKVRRLDLCIIMPHECMQIWCPSTGKLVHTLIGHTSEVTCLDYRGNYIVSGSLDMTLRSVSGLSHVQMYVAMLCAIEYGISS